MWFHVQLAQKIFDGIYSLSSYSRLTQVLGNLFSPFEETAYKKSPISITFFGRKRLVN